MIILRLTASGSGSGFEVYNVSIKNYQNKNGVTILLHTDVYNKLLAKDQGGLLGHVGENPRNSVTIVTPPRFEFSDQIVALNPTSTRHKTAETKTATLTKKLPE